MLCFFCGPATAAEAPVIVSATSESYSVAFSGADSGLSFAVDTNGADSLVTGGGWIAGTLGGHASFGLVAGTDEGAFRGSLSYVDHLVGLRVKSTEIVALAPGACTAEFLGTATVNDVPGSAFIVVVTDAGEPGANDTFTISVAGYSNSGLLVGGDIRMHDQPCN